MGKCIRREQEPEVGSLVVGKEAGVALQEGLSAAPSPHAHAHLHRIEANLAAVEKDDPIQVLFVGTGQGIGDR